MKCPSCGYENKDDARYCNLCQNSFVREPAAAYGLPSLAKPGAERAKAAQKALRSQPKGLNWFQRHLNWTWVFAQWAAALIIYFIVTVFVVSLVGSGPNFPSEASFFASISVIQMVSLVLNLAAEIGVGAWVLRRKKRSLAWLLIFLVPLVGWIIFLCLENRSEFVVMPAKTVTRSPISPGLAPQGLGNKSDKYWW